LHPFAERFPRLWAFLESVSVLVLGGLLFWLFTIAGVTMPAALVGLYAAVGAMFRPMGGTPFTRFWTAFRRTFGTALLLGLLDLVLGVILYVDIRVFWSMGSLLTRGLALLMGSVALMALMVNLFAWPLLAFYPQRLGKLLKRAFLLSAAHPFLALGGVVAPLVLLLLMLMLPPRLLGLAVILGPGLLATAAGAIAWQAMKRYADPEEDDELI
jgi:uncharacterized membrane protein YesL